MTNFDGVTRVTDPAKTFRLTGYHVAAMFVAFFGVIIIVNFTMAWLASNSWTGLVVKNSYVASQHYNEKIDAARNQKNLGWRTEFAYSENTLILSIRDKDNNPINFEKLSITIGTPVAEYKDRSISLNRQNSGSYRAEIELSKGVWAYQLLAEGENPYRFEGRFFINDRGVGKIQ